MLGALAQKVDALTQADLQVKNGKPNTLQRLSS